MAKYSLIATCALLATAAMATAAVTPGVGFNVDASLDTDGDDRWEDTTAGNGMELLLDDSPAVTRVPVVSSFAGITAAYQMPGGSIGNEAGALFVRPGSTSAASFKDDAVGGWDDEDVSIEVWFRPDNLTPTPDNGQILFEDGGGTGLGLFVDDNQLRLRKQGGNGVVSSDISAIGGDFIQAIGTYRVSTGDLELFVNGAPAGTGSASGGSWTGGDGAAVGTRGESNVGGIGNGQSDTESFAGQIAIMRIYRNQLLGAGEAAANYSAVANNAPEYVLGSGLVELNAARDDGLNSTWENTGNAGGFDAALSGQTHNSAPSTSLPGVTAAYEFNGSGQATFDSLSGLAGDTDVSIEMLVRTSDLVGSEILFESGGSNGIGLLLGAGTSGFLTGVSDSALTFAVQNNDEPAIVTVDLAGIGVSEFIHIIATLDSSTGIATLYLNGLEVGTDDGVNLGTWSGSDNAALAGRGGSNVGGLGNGDQGFGNFEGEIALFRVLDSELGQAEVTARYQAVVVPEPVSLALLAAGGLLFTRRRCGRTR